MKMMENIDISDILLNGAKSLGIELPLGAVSAFELYYSFLAQRGSCVNLTAITGVEDVARLHFLDSIALLNYAHFKNARVIDVGSGAGFPGVALKIAEPSITLTLLDSTGKRVSFLNNLCALLGFESNCVHARAEDASRTQGFRECFDIAVSRAVARLNILCELCLPFVRVGGIFISMKSFSTDDEVSEATNAIETLGAELLDCFAYNIPETDISNRAVLIRKTASTPDKYPRRFSRIQNSPL